ncbi:MULTISPECIES: hypothetical protein [Gordonia]|uniref:Secreted protein n=1 Tax=Gordonia pseudamarae TaxID=2831662 RepID=A0ABX6IJI7_9ACTN|nr:MULTISPECIES: hypothetical protein [Gordonia]MBD0023030.1 hypothetical protein [Gordonia sp. (in: high G+C Gram-positive bacteria)]QHN36057.1 hypothetical protein GII31_15460 [Gordonia pseudamarae]
MAGSLSTGQARSRTGTVRVATATLAIGAVTAFGVALPAGTAQAAPTATAPKATAQKNSHQNPGSKKKSATRKRTTPGNRLPTREEIEAIAVPLDRELAGVVRMLKAAGIDQMAIQAAQVILASNGQLSVDALNSAVATVYNNIGRTHRGYAGTPTEAPGTAADRTTTSRTTASRTTAPGTAAPRPTTRPDRSAGQRTGLRTFTPVSAPICTRPTSDNPLGLATLVGHLSGRWPVAESPRTLAAATRAQNLPRLVLPTAIDPRLVDTGEVAFALAPVTTPTPTSTTTADRRLRAAPAPTGQAPNSSAGKKTAATGPIRIAWLNTTTLQGGFADLVTDATTETLPRALASSHGLRLAPIKSRFGTELAFVSNTSRDDERGCSFVPVIRVATS